MGTKIEKSMRRGIFLLVFMGILSTISLLGMYSVNKIDKNPPIKIHQIIDIIKF